MTKAASRAPLVVLDNASVELGGSLILRDISWQLGPGQHWVVLGQNGSGKSTFLRLVRGEVWPLVAPEPPRLYNLTPPPQVTAVGIREAFALVSPELHHRYLQIEWNLRVSEVIRSGVGGGDYVYQSLTPDQRRHVAAVTELLRVQHLVTRNIQELSTGELRRVLIARALAARPRVLVCDEIGDGLDAGARATLLAALDDAALQGTQLLVSTHRGDEVPTAMTHRLMLEDGRIVEQRRLGRRRGRAMFDSCFQESRAPAPAQMPAVGTPPPRAADSPAKSDGQESNRPGRPDACATASHREDGPVLIEIAGADVYLGTAPTLREINLKIHQGRHWAIVGPNGSGKSTLLKLIAGDVHPAWGGHVRRFSFTPKNTIWELRARLGVVSPELHAAYREAIPAADVIASGFHATFGLHERISARQRRQVRQVCARLHLTPLARRNFLELSFGEARRVLLARALVNDPALILFDEPFDGLDVPARALMRHALEEAAASGATLVVVTHHEEDLPACIHQVARMDHGRLAEVFLR